MHDATTTNPCTFNLHGADAEGIRMALSEQIRRDTPARIEPTPRLARISDAISVLKRKRDRYKGRGKLIQAAAVQACIDELRGVWK